MILKEIRKSKGFEQKQFADIVGINLSTYNRIENDKLDDISSDYINKIAIGLELTNEQVMVLFNNEDYISKCIRVLKDIKENGK